MSEMTLGSQMHLTPTSGILYTVDEGDCVGNLYIRAQGARRINELADTIYIKDAKVPYHSHEEGYETFMVDGGSVEIFVNGKTAVLEEGDLLQIRPYVGHGFHILEEGTIWREMFQDLELYAGVEAKDVLTRYNPDIVTDPEFLEMRAKSFRTYYRDTPVCAPASKYDIPEVRAKGHAIRTFETPYGAFHLKVGRWETDGVKEIWEIAPHKGVKIDWQLPHSNTDLFLVQSGAVHVQADGGNDFVARAHEIINIPPYHKHSITAVEDGTSFYAFNVQSNLMHIMERFNHDSVHEPEKLKDWAYLKSVLREFNCWATGISGAK